MNNIERDRGLRIYRAVALIAIALLLPTLTGCASGRGDAGSSDPAAPVIPAEVSAIAGSLELPDEARPLQVAAAMGRATAHPGESVTLYIVAKLAPGWHIYAATGPRGIGLPTHIEPKPPPALRLTGDWTYPPASDGPDKSTVYEGETLVFSRTVEVAQRAPYGPVTLPIRFQYQACNAFRCLPPQTLTLTAHLNITPYP